MIIIRNKDSVGYLMFYPLETSTTCKLGVKTTRTPRFLGEMGGSSVHIRVRSRKIRTGKLMICLLAMLHLVLVTLKVRGPQKHWF